MSATAQRSKLVAIPCDSAKAATASRTTCSRLTATEGASGHRKETYMDRAARDQHRITVMLIIVVVVFLLCQLPQAIQHIYKIYHVVCAHKPAEYEHQVMRITGNVFNFLVMVNCATNFILYSAFSTKFRATFSQLFCRCNDTSSGWSRSCYCNCCYGTATAARDRTRNTAVAGRYAALNAGGRPTTGRTGRWEADNRLGSANPFVWRDKNDVECEKEEDAISALTHTPTTIDKLTMSPDQEPEDITHL